MNEDTAAVTLREGEITIRAEDTADETAADSQSEVENKDEGAQSDDGKKSDGEKEPAFHEHPRWKDREKEWNDRFNQQETRHQEDLKAIREEFGGQRKENAQNTKIPAWFGGTQEQWDAYRSDRDAELKAIEDRAIERAEKNFESKAGAQSKAVEEATDFLNSEVTAIEADKELNPTGIKIDRQALLKVVLDNELIDSKGRWNYRAGFKILNAGAKAPEQKKDPKDNERKQIAAGTINDKGGDEKKPTYATSDDFKKNRPW